MMRGTDKVLTYLKANPGWHYGLDIVKAGVCGRMNIYLYLGRLEELGLVERMEGAKTHPGLPRPLYRAALPKAPKAVVKHDLFTTAIPIEGSGFQMWGCRRCFKEWTVGYSDQLLHDRLTTEECAAGRQDDDLNDKGVKDHADSDSTDRRDADDRA